jgi:hypothetical protein
MHGDSDSCLNERKNNRTTSAFDDPSWDYLEDTIFCSLSSSAMTHLLGRLDRGLGAVPATQKACINRKVTRDQIATVLTAAQAGRDERAAVGPKLDDQLAAVIRQCTRD